MEPLDLNAFLDDFRAEATEHVRDLDAQLVAMERDPANPQFVRAMFLSAHSIKGGAAMLGLDDVRGLAHAMEDVLDELRAHRRTLDDATAILLFQAVDRLRDLIGRSTPDQSEPDAPTARLVDELRSTAQGAIDVQPEPPPTMPSDYRPRVLIVDDSATVRFLASAQLKSGGFDVDTASDSGDALLKLTTGAYELVVAAMETRGLRGPDLAKVVRSLPRYHDVPIILMTSAYDVEPRHKAREFPGIAYVQKGSFNNRLLLDTALTFVSTPVNAGEPPTKRNTP